MVAIMWPFRKHQRGAEDLSIGALLIDRGLITRDQLLRAIETKLASSKEQLIGEILVAQYAVTRDQLNRVLVEQAKLRGPVHVMQQETRRVFAAATAELENLHGSVRDLKDVAEKYRKGE